MRGVGSPVGRQPASSCLEILVEKDYYSIGRWSFSKPADTVLEMLTDEILEGFEGLRRTVNKQERPEIERLVRATARDRFTLLGRTCNLTNGNACDPLSDDLLKYLLHCQPQYAAFCLPLPGG